MACVSLDILELHECRDGLIISTVVDIAILQRSNLVTWLQSLLTSSEGPCAGVMHKRMFLHGGTS